MKFEIVVFLNLYGAQKLFFQILQKLIFGRSISCWVPMSSPNKFLVNLSGPMWPLET